MPPLGGLPVSRFLRGAAAGFLRAGSLAGGAAAGAAPNGSTMPVSLLAAGFGSAAAACLGCSPASGVITGLAGVSSGSAAADGSAAGAGGSAAAAAVGGSAGGG